MEQPAEHEGTNGTAVTAAERLLPHVGQGISRVARELNERRGLRTALLGGLLVGIALILGMDSALTIPFVIAGFLLVAIGSLGPRLSGRMAIEFGASGTVIEMRTEITPPGTVASEHNRTLPLPVAIEESASSATDGAEVTDAEVVEATGETIEIEVTKLEALIEAAGEPAERFALGSPLSRDGVPAQNLRRSG